MYIDMYIFIYKKIGIDRLCLSIIEMLLQLYWYMMWRIVIRFKI